MASHSPLRRCTSPGCPHPVVSGRCAVHSRLARRQRGFWTELYGTEWPAIRLDYLRRHPACVLCGRMATVADHYPRGIRLLIKQNNPHPHADHHLRPLCWSCHSRQTGIREPGGYVVGRQ